MKHHLVNCFHFSRRCVRYFVLVSYDKLIIHFRFLKMTNETISLNISSVVSSV